MRGGGSDGTATRGAATADPAASPSAVDALVGPEDATGGAPDVRPGAGRQIDGWDPRLVAVLTALGFGLPLVGYLWFVDRFAVDVPIADQWVDVRVIKGSYAHVIDWGPMWAQHNENRIFFPNVVVVLLAHIAHFNIRWEEFLGAAMLIAATALILWAHKRRSATTPWLYYCPVAFVALSVVQYENTLWGFQIAWYMVFLALATTIVLLDRFVLTWLALGGAIAAAVLGSYSSLQGLLIWPAGLVLLYLRRRPLRLIGVWIGAAAASAVLYFYNFDFATGSPHSRFAVEHPLATMKFFLSTVGNVLGRPMAPAASPAKGTAVMVFGLVVVLLAVATLAICGLRPDPRGGAVGISLIVYGLLFAALVTQGRSSAGIAEAGASRYTTFSLLIIIGIYLALLGRRSGAVDPQSPAAGPGSPASLCRPGRRPGWVDRIAVPAVLAITLLVVVVQLSVGSHAGLEGARQFHTSQVAAAAALLNIDHESDAQLARAEPFVPVSFLRAQVRTLKAHRLTVFAHQ